MLPPDLVPGMGPRRIEVPQRCPSQTKPALEMRQRPFHRQLGLSVTVDRPLRMGFGNWRFDWLAVGGARRRQYECGDPLGRHRFEYADRAAHVVPVVADRIADRFADI